jgi:hypothetical protein
MTDSGIDLPQVLATIEAVNYWLDAAVADTYQDQPLAQDWARVAKLTEEAGEAIAALIAFTGQNPRKGVCGSEADVVAELADTACCAMFAIQHFTGDIEATWAIISAALEKAGARVTVSVPEPNTTEEPP